MVLCRISDLDFFEVVFGLSFRVLQDFFEVEAKRRYVHLQP